MQLRYVTRVAHSTDIVHIAHAHAVLPVLPDVGVPEVADLCACVRHVQVVDNGGLDDAETPVCACAPCY